MHIYVYTYIYILIYILYIHALHNVFKLSVLMLFLHVFENKQFPHSGFTTLNATPNWSLMVDKPSSTTLIKKIYPQAI